MPTAPLAPPLSDVRTEPAEGRRGPLRRAARWAARCALLLVVLLAVSVGANAVLSVHEGLTQTYGHRVTVPHGSLNTTVTGAGEETFVIMPGFGSSSPVLEFAPLVDDLDDHATVVVVEPIGVRLERPTVDGRAHGREHLHRAPPDADRPRGAPALHARRALDRSPVRPRLRQPVPRGGASRGVDRRQRPDQGDRRGRAEPLGPALDHQRCLPLGDVLRAGGARAGAPRHLLRGRAPQDAHVGAPQRLQPRRWSRRATGRPRTSRP